MPSFHEIRVDVKGGEINLTFHQKVRNGKKRVGQLTAKRNDPDALIVALEAEVAKIAASKGARRK